MQYISKSWPRPLWKNMVSCNCSHKASNWLDSSPTVWSIPDSSWSSWASAQQVLHIVAMISQWFCLPWILTPPGSRCEMPRHAQIAIYGYTRTSLCKSYITSSNVFVCHKNSGYWFISVHMGVFLVHFKINPANHLANNVQPWFGIIKTEPTDD